MIPNELSQPYSENAEKSILSMMCIAPDTIIPRAVADGVDESWFYIPKHRILFNTLLHRFQNGQSVDAVSIAEHLSDTKQLDAVGNYAGLSEVLAFSTLTFLYQPHLKILKDKRDRRLCIQLAIQAADTKLPFNLLDCMDIAEHHTSVRGHSLSYQESLAAGLLRHNPLPRRHPVAGGIDACGTLVMRASIFPYIIPPCLRFVNSFFLFLYYFSVPCCFGRTAEGGIP